jgi:GNAT superfamily N-acetyltransferase/catechol 2,3-dioxygenase-like lactoylglutathione lyase family enzyme
LFEAHLTVRDMGRAVSFYRDVVGLEPAFELPERDAAFLWIGPRREGMLGLWSLGSAPMGLSLHIALTTSLEDVLGACDRLRSLGVTPLSFFEAETTEPSVIGWMPAAAVYFRDPDGHLLEYLAMLDEAPRPDRGIVPWSEWSASASPVRVEQHTGPRAGLRPLFALAEDSPTQLDSYLELGRVLVALSGDDVVGHLQLTETGDPEEAEVRNMAVLPAHRRRGIGRALVSAGIALARAEGRSAVLVATAAADIDNLRFYQQAGFRMRSIEPDAFTAATGYGPQTKVDGIELRDRVWLALSV